VTGGNVGNRERAIKQSGSNIGFDGLQSGSSHAVVSRSGCIACLANAQRYEILEMKGDHPDQDGRPIPTRRHSSPPGIDTVQCHPPPRRVCHDRACPMQLVGPAFGDALVLEVAAAYERCTEWRSFRPSAISA
jgi:hypothetical protein